MDSTPIDKSFESVWFCIYFISSIYFIFSYSACSLINISSQPYFQSVPSNGCLIPSHLDTFSGLSFSLIEQCIFWCLITPLNRLVTTLFAFYYKFYFYRILALRHGCGSWHMSFLLLGKNRTFLSLEVNWIACYAHHDLNWLLRQWGRFARVSCISMPYVLDCKTY